MKNILLLSKLLFFIFCCSCTDESIKSTKVEKVKPDAIVKSEESQDIDIEQNKQIGNSLRKFKDLPGISLSNQPTQYSIVSIGNTKINKRTKRPIKITGERIIVTGWAIDEINNSLPGKVYLDIDGNMYEAAIGKKWNYLRDKFMSPALQSAGFRASLSLKNISKGSHDLSLFVISSDLSKYYPPIDKMEIIVE